MDVLQQLGIKSQKKPNYERAIFYFLREFHIYPFDEEFVVKPVYDYKKVLFFRFKKIIGYKVTKKGIPIALWNSLISEMEEHYRKEESEYKKLRRR